MMFVHTLCEHTRIIIIISLLLPILRLELKFADIEDTLSAQGSKFDPLLWHVKAQLISLRDVQDDAKAIKLAKSVESQIDQLKTLAQSLPAVVIYTPEPKVLTQVLTPVKNSKKGSFRYRN